ncbi:MAG: hypothetical protein AAF587_26185 [Bacteroidota bacterium]
MNLPIFRTALCILMLLSLWIPGLAGEPDVIVIHDASIPKSQKEAILILPGLQDSKKGRAHQTEMFARDGYDLYIPDYRDRPSYEGTVKKLHQFFEREQLGEYKKLHVFSYILGSWVLNSFIHTHGIQNIASIVYDRSPLQERAPKLLRDRFRLIGNIMFGKVAVQLADVPYAPIDTTGLNIGVLVENKATWFIKLFKKRSLSYGAIDWADVEVGQAYDDLMFVPLSHDEMYVELQDVYQDIFLMFQKGRFRKEARRQAYSWDPFKGPPKK